MFAEVVEQGKPIRDDRRVVGWGWHLRPGARTGGIAEHDADAARCA